MQTSTRNDISVGSDSSYDLIVRVVTHAQGEKITIKSMQRQNLPKAREICCKVSRLLEDKLIAFPYQLEVELFNTLPDEFVWLGRLEGAMQKAYELEQHLIDQLPLAA